MKTDAQRIARYNARMQSQLVGPAMATQLPTMVTNYGAYLDEFYLKQEACAQILSENDVALTLRFGYQAFNNEVYHATKVLSDDALATEVCILNAKYVALGLVEATLDLILVGVWSLPACAAAV